MSTQPPEPSLRQNLSRRAFLAALGFLGAATVAGPLQGVVAAPREAHEHEDTTLAQATPGQGSATPTPSRVTVPRTPSPSENNHMPLPGVPPLPGTCTPPPSKEHDVLTLPGKVAPGKSSPSPSPSCSTPPKHPGEHEPNHHAGKPAVPVKRKTKSKAGKTPPKSS